MLAALLEGVQNGWHIRWGMEVKEVTIQRTPEFGEQQRFLVQSPVLIKRREETERNYRYYYYSDKEADALLTETLQHKLSRAGLTQEASVAFDKSYPNPKTKMVNYRGIDIRASACPVIVTGDPRAVGFAWEVGVGNSTGIGFGALR